MRISRLQFPLALLIALTLVLATAPLWSPLLHAVLAPLPVFPLALHTTMEVFAIVVSMAVFAISWQTYAGARSGNAVILGCGFLCVGLLDFAHMMSYMGMPDFVTPASPHKAIVFWLQARYIAALTLLTIALRTWAPLASPRTPRWLLAASLGLCLLLYASQLMYPGFWPLTFIEGQGLTPIKIALEYLLIALLLPTAWLFHRQRRDGTNARANHLLAAVLITILSELCFTLYTNVYSSYSLLGHLYKIIAYLFIYQAIFVGAVREPYTRLHEEVTQRTRAEKTAEYLAYHDTLTQMPNRALLQDRFQQAMTPQHRKQDSPRVAVIFADTDQFKLINDTYGHGVGDELLAASAQRLNQLLRKSDTLSRYSADQFVILLSDLDPHDNALQVVHEILHNIQQPFVLQGREVIITLSLGIALSGDDHELDTLIHKSETAMARAKAAGGNAYRYFEESMNTAAEEYLKIRDGLRRALERKEFELHYQPQIDLQTRSVVGVEALVRWNHPEWGRVPPDKFIPVAEECHLIVALGNWILDEACRQAVIWQNLGLPPLRMSVNLSALQFESPDFERRIIDSLDNAGLDYRLLELELTESVLMQQEGDALPALLKRLKRTGIRIALDDFGTGYSSLSYLRRFDVNTLKIDQSFTRGIAEHEDDLAIVNAVIQMAHSLGLQVIAEGVETEAMCEVLERFGCDEGQGYLFARPMAAADFLEFMRDRRDYAAA